jgi:hypothetical protein
MFDFVEKADGKADGKADWVNTELNFTRSKSGSIWDKCPKNGELLPPFSAAIP